MRPRAIALVAARDAGQAFGSRWFVLASGCFLVLSLGLSMLGPAAEFGLVTFGASGLVTLLVAMLAATAISTLAAGYVLFRKVPVT